VGTEGTNVDDGRPSRLERALDRVPFLEKELFLLRRLVAPGDVCLDIGAAGGAHLLVMAQAVGPQGHVVGFEPRPGSLRMLERVVRLAGLGNRVRLLPIALSDRRGEVELRIPVVPTRAHFHGSTADRRGTAAFRRMPYREIQVPTDTLDAVVAAQGLDRVDVVKCDVEGAELLVLAGATRVLEELRPILIVEADDLHQRRYDATAQDVLDAVVACGYRVHRYRRGVLERVHGIVDGEDDYVFVPAERGRPTPAGRVGRGRSLR
jgi:FkbM family methyltransferase